MKFKYLILFIVLLSIALIVYGFVLKPDKNADLYIGLGTVGLFLLAMPLFLIKESRGKKMKDYMLTRENIEKMKINDRRNTENQ
ncbi:MAG: hypothetical protein AAGB24_01920 [Bacteroidota bacterium]